jgi:hypothetical protein
MRPTKFGRGIFAYAQAGPPPVAAQQDGQYRTAVFTPNAQVQRAIRCRPTLPTKWAMAATAAGPTW